MKQSVLLTVPFKDFDQIDEKANSRLRNYLNFSSPILSIAQQIGSRVLNP
jgi:hypothetical protein